MDILKLSALAFILYMQVHNAGASPSEDGDIWTVENLQEKPQVTDVFLRFADLMKRSKSQHGLMGSSAGNTQPLRLGRRRNKGEIFVGLMGRRSLSGELQEQLERPQL
ncbi:tachykinin-4 [Danio aesculapii]|uniref:tachykinin-4 n=1 Tax=Danio aesculapii TaxID=1142201 RepID=UPI0024C0610F|nr:tachykinin-4 [Danio aesculapii]